MLVVNGTTLAGRVCANDILGGGEGRLAMNWSPYAVSSVEDRPLLLQSLRIDTKALVRVDLQVQGPQKASRRRRAVRAMRVIWFGAYRVEQYVQIGVRLHRGFRPWAPTM